MNPEAEEIYAGFEREGAAQVRVNLASHVYGEVRERHANAWLGLKDREAADSQRTSEMSLAAEAHALARAANDIASQANDLAVRALAKARDSNTIAIIAIIIAAIAIPISIVAIFVK